MLELAMMRSEMKPFSDLPVKSEKDEFDDPELRPRGSKRSKLSMTISSSPQSNQCGFEKKEFPVSSEYNPLDEPSPIGLRLKKSPSLLELIQMRLSEGRAATSMASVLRSADEKDARATTTAIATEKLKASNFAASLLRIGCWEFVSRYEGDLVGKCYYAKHKLVWEILQGGLKIKMEIQWSDIMALQANCPDGGPGKLSVVLSRPPAFYRESDPQPRKHTLWQSSSDFTNGQASIHRKHYLEFPPGVLNKHYEKLIQCDPRLNFLSQQPEMVLESMLFYTQDSHRKGSDELGASGYGQYLCGKASPVSCLSGVLSPSITEISSVNYEQMDTASSLLSKEAPSPCTVSGAHANDGNDNCEHFDSGVLKKDQSNVPGLRPSMSMSDLVNHIGNCISEQVTSGNIPRDKASECQHILEDISEVLLSDTHSIQASDEKSLMKRVNSLWSLLQDPATPSSLQQVNGVNELDGFCYRRDDQNTPLRELMHETRTKCDAVSSTDINDGLSFKPTPSISRKDSLGDLLLQLPRIASLSKFLFDISENDENEAK